MSHMTFSIYFFQSSKKIAMTEQIEIKFDEREKQQT